MVAIAICSFSEMSVWAQSSGSTQNTQISNPTFNSGGANATPSNEAASSPTGSNQTIGREGGPRSDEGAPAGADTQSNNVENTDSSANPNGMNATGSSADTNKINTGNPAGINGTNTVNPTNDNNTNTPGGDNASVDKSTISAGDDNDATGNDAKGGNAATTSGGSSDNDASSAGGSAKTAGGEWGGTIFMIALIAAVAGVLYWKRKPVLNWIMDESKDFASTPLSTPTHHVDAKVLEQAHIDKPVVVVRVPHVDQPFVILIQPEISATNMGTSGTRAQEKPTTDIGTVKTRKAENPVQGTRTPAAKMARKNDEADAPSPP